MRGFNIIKIAGILLFISVLIYSIRQPVFDVDRYIASLQTGAVYSQINKKPDIFDVTFEDGRREYLGFSYYIGYAGPLTVATTINREGAVTGIEVVAHKETPVYMGKLYNKRFFDQFRGKPATAPLHLDTDIDSISGATITCLAVTESARAVTHRLALETFGTAPTVTREKFTFGAAEIIVILYFMAVILFSGFIKRPKWRLYMLLISIGILGFWLNRSLSISMITSAFLGYFPMMQQNLLWYILVFGTLLLVLLSGKNLYCSWICPFGGVQEYANKVTGGVRMGFKGKALKAIRLFREVLMFCLMGLAFVMINPSVGTIEPFGTLFGLNGTVFPWAVCFIAILASLFSLRFWCNTFCPVGAFLDIISRARRLVFQRPPEIPPKKAAADASPGTARRTDSFVVVSYILLGLSVLAVLYTGLKELL